MGAACSAQKGGVVAAKPQDKSAQMVGENVELPVTKEEAEAQKENVVALRTDDNVVKTTASIEERVAKAGSFQEAVDQLWEIECAQKLRSNPGVATGRAFNVY